ncbi:MAG: Gfo/Idh/MocA family oxidoreductase [Gemmatimonadota bacterium]|nr:Gfo/Idh/MocA family oxidoreductase [Gemmatimonadota bacterium]
MGKVRIAVFGAGNWGRNHVRTLASMPDVSSVVVCDTDPTKREAIAVQVPGVETVASFDEIGDKVDGVVVATPASVHGNIALQAIELGLPVLVEKPLALSLDEAKTIVDASKRADVPVLVGHLLLFHPVVIRLRELVQAGDFGDLYYLYSQRVNLGQIRPDENALWSFGPHDVSVAMYLLDEYPSSVSAHGQSFLQPGVEDVVFMSMEFASGRMAHMQMSWLDPHKERKLTVVGSKKMAVFDDMAPREKLRIYDKGVERPPEYRSYGESLAVREGDVLIPRVPLTEPLRAELQHFVAVVRDGVAPVVTARDGYEVVRVLASASESLAGGGTMVPVSSD